jgi:hypothetical protein
VYGTASDVERLASSLESDGNLGPPVRDVVHSSGMKYRLIVFEQQVLS